MECRMASRFLGDLAAFIGFEFSTSLWLYSPFIQWYTLRQHNTSVVLGAIIPLNPPIESIHQTVAAKREGNWGERESRINMGERKKRGEIVHVMLLGGNSGSSENLLLIINEKWNRWNGDEGIFEKWFIRRVSWGYLY